MTKLSLSKLAAICVPISGLSSLFDIDKPDNPEFCMAQYMTPNPIHDDKKVPYLPI